MSQTKKLTTAGQVLLIFFVGLASGFLIGQRYDLDFFASQKMSNGWTGNLLISSGRGWQVEQKGKQVKVCQVFGQGSIVFGPTLPNKQAMIAHKDKLKFQATVREALNGDIVSFSSVSQDKNPALLRVEGFVVCRDLWTYFVGTYPKNRSAAEDVQELFKGIRELV